MRVPDIRVHILACIVALSGCGRLGFDSQGAIATDAAPPGEGDAAPDVIDAMPVPISCMNGEYDGLETDVDCGGPECPPCGAGAKCDEPVDCESSVCLDFVCQLPSCEDGVQNGAEEGVDCGGIECVACPENLAITFGAGLNEAASGVDIMESGQIVLVGSTADLGGDGSVMVATTDPLGNGLFNHRIGTDSPENANAVVEDGNRFIVAGQTYDFGGQGIEPYLLSIDALSGSVLSSQTSGSTAADTFHGVDQTVDGYFIAVGETQGFGATGIDVLIQVFDPALNLVETRRFGGPGDDIARAVRATADGGAAIVGTSTSFGQGDADALVIRIDSAGLLLWAAAYGGSGAENAVGVAELADGGLVVAADTTSFGAGGTDIYVIRIDAWGNLVWADAYGGQDAELAGGVEIIAGSDIVVVGSTRSMGAGGSDILLLRMSTAGLLRWIRPIGGPGDDQGHAVAIQGERIVVAGVTDSFGAEGQQMYLLRLGANGDNATVCGQVGGTTMLGAVRGGLGYFIDPAAFEMLEAPARSVPTTVEYMGLASPECSATTL